MRLADRPMASYDLAVGVVVCGPAPAPPSGLTGGSSLLGKFITDAELAPAGQPSMFDQILFYAIFLCFAWRVSYSPTGGFLLLYI